MFPPAESRLTRQLRRTADIATNPLHQVPLIVLEADPSARSLLMGQLTGPAESLASVQELTLSTDGGPLVLLLGPSFASTEGIGQILPFLTDHPEVAAILVTDELSTELLQVALRSGVKDVLAAPVTIDQLMAAVVRVSETLGSASLVRDQARGADQERGGISASDGLEGDRAKVLTVFSTKGGAGKSVLAVNLATVLARRSDKPVVLVDADLQFGDIAVMLSLAPHHTIVDAVGSLDRLDAELLQQYLLRHQPSGLLILPAPLEPSFAEQITAEEIMQIVAILRTFCSFVVIDTPAYFNEVVLAIIEDSDEILLMAGMDIPNIKNVKIGLQTLRLLNLPMEKVHLVLNRANSKVKLDVSEVEKTLQIKAEALIPSDVVVPQSVNKGTPVVIDAPRSGVAKSIEQLARMFLSDGRRR